MNEEIHKVSPLKIDVKSIRYIIVSNERDRKRIIKVIEKLYSNDDRIHLSSKILTKIQIAEDF